jgi:lysophospholipase L1-like esterase
MRRRLISFLLALTTSALLASLAANLWLLQRGELYYRQLGELRLDPYGLEAFPAAEAPAAGRRVVFFGDSRAALWVAPSIAGHSFLNRGIGGQTCAQVAGRFAAHIAPLKPDVIVVQVGINDLKLIPLFPERQAQIVARCRDRIAEIVAHGREAGATIILTTVFPPAAIPPERRALWSDTIDVAIEQLNAQIRSMRAPGVLVLETGPILADERGVTRAEYSSDELHLRPEGYAALNAALVQLLER